MLEGIEFLHPAKEDRATARYLRMFGVGVNAAISSGRYTEILLDMVTAAD